MTVTKLKNAIKDMEETVAAYKESYDEALEDSHEHSKEFEEEHEEYFDLAELHLARIGQVMMDEL